MNLKRLLGRLEVENDRFFPCHDTSNLKKYNYKKIIDNCLAEVYQVSDVNGYICSAFGSVVVTRNPKSNNFKIYPNYSLPLYCHKVKFNNKNFPGLIPNSSIINILVVPYLREVGESKFYKRWRVVVFTDKCQVYHNFPSRDMLYEGLEEFGDITRFEESVVWDIPMRKYPSKNVNCDADVEVFNPLLPEESYQHHPSINKHSAYGNVGFQKYSFVQDNIKVSRFYFPIRSLEANPFYFMGGYEPDYKMTLIGTYRSNKEVGSRTCIFATSDGGRNWYAKYEFADSGTYEFKQGIDTWGQNYGNKLNGTYFTRSFEGTSYLQKRELILDDEKRLFYWDVPIKISHIFNEDEIRIETTENHNLENGSIVAIKKSSNEPSEWDLLFNNTFNEKSSGNGKIYKVKVLDEKNLILKECVSNPYNNIPCRHVHHINRVRDGWIIGTGEIYPNGWLLFASMLESDTFSRVNAASTISFFKLNTSPKSVQRTIGCDLIDRTNPMIIVASDHDKLNRKKLRVRDGISIERNSTGIYIGKLEDIDDFSKFDLVYEAKEPAFFFKKINNHYIFSGQRGEFAISDSSGKKWVSCRTREPLIHYFGSTYSFHIIDKYIIKIK